MADIERNTQPIDHDTNAADTTNWLDPDFASLITAGLSSGDISVGEDLLKRTIATSGEHATILDGFALDLRRTPEGEYQPGPAANFLHAAARALRKSDAGIADALELVPQLRSVVAQREEQKTKEADAKFKEVTNFDHIGRFVTEVSGVAAGRQVAKNNKILDFSHRLPRVDVKGAAIVVAHGIFPMATRAALMDPDECNKSGMAKVATRDSWAYGMGELDLLPWATLALLAYSDQNKVDPVIVFAAMKTIMQAAAVVGPDILRSAKEAVVPIFHRQTDLPHNRS